MPRKVVSIADSLIEFVMTAPIADVSELLKTATLIVTTRAKLTAAAPAKPATTRTRTARPAVQTPTGPREVPGKLAKVVDPDAAASVAAGNRQTGGLRPPVRPAGQRGPRRTAPPPMTAAPTTPPATPAPPAEPIVPDNLPPQVAEE
jgi:hypothetical protein